MASICFLAMTGKVKTAIAVCVLFWFKKQMFGLNYATNSNINDASHQATPIKSINLPRQPVPLTIDNNKK